ncbi:MAG: mandelate racemase/muconate lactonizing enzyme family protein [Actinobacteria bacterium]|nr:mandelate racemase/muconate lactonizing enzyme family protein [Actinomycetota bacterium]
MKVTKVDVHVVSVPFTKPETWRFGRLWGLTNAIVEVHTDEGITGIGEVPGSPLISLVRDALEATAPWIVGHDPLRVTEFLTRCQDRGWHHYPYLGNEAQAGIEMALWDIAGKAHGCPVHQFFGGLQTEEVPFYWFINVNDRDPETARAEAAEGVERGFDTVYIKIGFDIDNDLAIARAIKDEVGDEVAFRVDANEGWTVFQARDALRRFEDVGVEFVEQPIDMHNIGGLADLRSKTRVRIAANQSAWLPAQVPDVIAQRAADVVVTDPHQLGGLVPFRNAITMCETAGLPVIKHAFGDTAITTVAAAHVLAAMPGPQLAHQQFVTFLVHDLLTERVEFVDGKLATPTGPGLGIELDREALELYKDVYEKYGEFEGYGPITPESPLPAELHEAKR